MTDSSKRFLNSGDIQNNLNNVNKCKKINTGYGPRSESNNNNNTRTQQRVNVKNGNSKCPKFQPSQQQPQKINQSISDSLLLFSRENGVPATKHGGNESCGGVKKLKHNPNTTTHNKTNCGIRYSNSSKSLTKLRTKDENCCSEKREREGQASNKISTNSVRLIQQFPQSFCSDEHSTSVTKHVGHGTSSSSSRQIVYGLDNDDSNYILNNINNNEHNTRTKEIIRNPRHPHQQLYSSSSTQLGKFGTEETVNRHQREFEHLPPSKVKASKSDMLTATSNATSVDMLKKPLTLMEQKKLQWAKEREELNGLWSPWGRPENSSTAPIVVSSSYMNKLQSSQLQSDCVLPPIINNKLGQQQNEKQSSLSSSSSSLWTCDVVDKEALSYRVARKSSVPICINASTGEVHYNLHRQQSDAFQVNNAILISNETNKFNNKYKNYNKINNTHNSTTNTTTHKSTTNSTASNSAIRCCKTSDRYRFFDRVSYSNALTSNSNNLSSILINSVADNDLLIANHGAGDWSSYDEETHTSGYQSEANGFMSNGEEYGWNSRNGSGDGCRVGPNSNIENKSAEKRHRSNTSSSKISEQMQQSVVVHNISLESRGHQGQGDSILNFSNNNMYNPHHQINYNNNSTNSIEKKNHLNTYSNPPPVAMRSSISVGLDSADSNSYKQLEKMEKEKWLNELEKQREEQRLRKQMEKDEKRPKWGDKGIGVGHFWEPSTPDDRLPPPSARDDISLETNTPAWVEKGLRMQNSISTPSIHDAVKSQSHDDKSDFQDLNNATVNQYQHHSSSSVDLRNVVGLSDFEGMTNGSNNSNERSFLRGHNLHADPEVTAEKDRKRQAALKHQEDIRKQMEERQQRLKQEKEKRLQEELADEEKIRLTQLHELEQLERETRKLSYANSDEVDEVVFHDDDLTEIKDVRKILNPDLQRDDLKTPPKVSSSPKKTQSPSKLVQGNEQNVVTSHSEGRRRFSVGDPNFDALAHLNSSNSNPDSQPINYLTASQSMINISRPNSSSFSQRYEGVNGGGQNEVDDDDDDDETMIAYDHSNSRHPQGRPPSGRPNSSSLQRSRSLSHNREISTQTDVDGIIVGRGGGESGGMQENKKLSQKHRSHNCLVKGQHQTHGSNNNKGSKQNQYGGGSTGTGEDSETNNKKKNEKPRWGATQSKKQYLKQSEKDPMYQQRLKRRMERIKRIEERINGTDGIDSNYPHGDTGTESEEHTSNINNNATSRRRGRSPASRFRSKQGNNNGGIDPPGIIRNNNSNNNSKNIGPMKATARIQIDPDSMCHSRERNYNHQHHKHASRSRERKNHHFETNHQEQQVIDASYCTPSNSGRSKKMFPDIPTIGPLKATTIMNDGGFDGFGRRQGSSGNSSVISRYSSPSLDNIVAATSTTTATTTNSKTIEQQQKELHHQHSYYSRVVGGHEKEDMSTTTVEMDLESRIISSSRSIEIHYDPSNNGTELLISPSTVAAPTKMNSSSTGANTLTRSTTKKTIISSSSDEITYRKKTVVGNQVKPIMSSDELDTNIMRNRHQQVNSNNNINNNNNNKFNNTGDNKKNNHDTPHSKVHTTNKKSHDSKNMKAEQLQVEQEEYEEQDQIGSVQREVKKSKRVVGSTSKPNEGKSSTTKQNRHNHHHHSHHATNKIGTDNQNPHTIQNSSSSQTIVPINNNNANTNNENPASIILNRLGSPPVPAVLKKLQAGIPLEDINRCDDLLYEIPRVSTAESTSNGYKSIESDSSSQSQPIGPPVISRISSSGGLEIDIDPHYELSSIQLGTSTRRNNKQDETAEQISPNNNNNNNNNNTTTTTTTEDTTEDKEFDDQYEDEYDDEQYEEEEEEEDEETDKYNGRYDDSNHESTNHYDDDQDDIKAKRTDHDEDDDDHGVDEEPPIYPYPIPKPVHIHRSSPSLSRTETPDSLHNIIARSCNNNNNNNFYNTSSSRTNSACRYSHPKVSSRTTTLEVMADYRTFKLPDYNFDSVKVIPHVDLGNGLEDVTAAIHNRPTTQDTDLSQREKLISYVINNKDIQAQISARDSEFSEKGIIEFNLRLPSNTDDISYDSVESRTRDYYNDEYKDPLLSERNRAICHWLYSSSDSSSNSNNSILTHLSYLKKGIQKQQKDWNVQVYSDTEEENNNSSNMSSSSKYST